MDLLDKSLLNSIPANMSVELCLVCGDRASGRHYGAISCEGCKGFFKRSIRKQLGYQCRGSMNCEVTKHHRNRCQFCRLQKCLASGMRSDSVQHERKPIADKKELQISTTNTTSTSATATATASTSANESGTEGITAAQNIFPVGFNFSDLQSFNKQRSLLTSGSYPTQLQTQQTQQQFLLTTNPYPQQDSFSFSSSTHTNEDDSMDNNSSCAHNSSLGNFGLTSENVATGLSITAAATAGFIQTSIDRNLINQSLDLVAAIQQQYINGVNNNNNNSRKMVSNRGGIRNRSNDNDNDLEMKDIKDVNCSNDCSGSHNNNNNNNVKTSSTTEGCYNDDDQDNDTGNIVKPELIIYDQGADSDDNSDDHFELPLVSKQNISFNIQAPSMVPSYLNTHYVCECGSRLLFLSVYWAKKIHTFQQLPEDIQISLLRRHWVELFAIGLPQCSQTLSISTILSTLVNNIIQLSELERVPAIKIRKLAEHAYMLNEFIQTFQAMNLDEYEYAYIRLIILFSPDNLNEKDNQSRIYIEKVQDYALKSLKMYLIENNHPASSDRCNKLLLRLMQLRALEPEFVEELFFSNLIGHIQVENMIPYILKLNDSEI